MQRVQECVESETVFCFNRPKSPTHLRDSTLGKHLHMRGSGPEHQRSEGQGGFRYGHHRRREQRLRLTCFAGCPRADTANLPADTANPPLRGKKMGQTDGKL